MVMLAAGNKRRVNYSKGIITKSWKLSPSEPLLLPEFASEGTRDPGRNFAAVLGFIAENITDKELAEYKLKEIIAERVSKSKYNSRFPYCTLADLKVLHQRIKSAGRPNPATGTDSQDNGEGAVGTNKGEDDGNQ